MIRKSIFFLSLLALAGCSITPAKQPTKVHGPKSFLKMDSKMLLDGRKFFSGYRQVSIEAYDSSEGCAFMHRTPRDTSAYLFTTTLKFEKPELEVEIPSDGAIYIAMRDDIGAMSSCTQAVSFVPEQDKKYYLDIMIQGDRTRICKAAVFEVTEAGPIPVGTFKWAGPKTFLKGIYNLRDSCQ